jgi:hypothetical protein
MLKFSSYPIVNGDLPALVPIRADAESLFTLENVSLKK